MGDKHPYFTKDGLISDSRHTYLHAGLFDSNILFYEWNSVVSWICLKSAVCDCQNKTLKCAYVTSAFIKKTMWTYFTINYY